MKNIILILFTSISLATNAQVAKVDLQASGLTCSMCSNAINKALKKLDFVNKVEADIRTYTFTISFTDPGAVDFDKIRKKVEDAGFSVSGFIATIYIENVQLAGTRSVNVGNQKMVFVNTTNETLNGTKQVRVLNKGFVSSKEFKNYGIVSTPGNDRVYHVSL